MRNYIIFGYDPDVFGYDASTNSFRLDATYEAGRDRVKLDITDNDRLFDGDQSRNEIGEDSNQTAIVTKPDGTFVDSGQVYVEAYANIRAPNGRIIMIDRIEIDGVLIGYLPSEQLVPGTSYEFIESIEVDNGDDTGSDTRLLYSQYLSLPCFAPETRIATPYGSKEIRDLREGDPVLTRDNNVQTIRWISSHRTALDRSTWPILIRKDAFAPGLPLRDLVLSAQHRVLVGAPRQLPCQTEQFAPAKGLVSHPGIRTMRGRTRQTWMHFALDRHEVVFAEGCAVESLLLGPMVMKMLPAAKRLRLMGLYPDPQDPRARNGPPARPCLTVREAMQFTARHAQRVDSPLMRA